VYNTFYLYNISNPNNNNNNVENIDDIIIYKKTSDKNYDNIISSIDRNYNLKFKFNKDDMILDQLNIDLNRQLNQKNNFPLNLNIS
jgi:hypothetical protein